MKPIDYKIRNFRIRTTSNSPVHIRSIIKHARSNTMANLHIKPFIEDHKRTSLFRNEKLREILASEPENEVCQSAMLKTANDKLNLIFLPILGISSQRILPCTRTIFMYKTIKKPFRILQSFRKVHV